MHDAQVNSERRHANLGDNVPSFLGELSRNSFLEWAIEATNTSSISLNQSLRPSLSKLKEVLQISYTLILGTRQIHMLRAGRREHDKLLTCSGDGHIQPALAPFLVHRAKAH
ncbi:hypothetical protein PF70_01844 [Pseudomonas asplenii]|nr:hypothetical protein PF70_01844 [Pseudomonas fuscovaginae]